MQANGTTIFGRACAHYPELHVIVARTPMYTYRVLFKDTNSDAVIESRVFQKCLRAYEYAYTLIYQD